jgi:hypothetical protein
MFARVSYVIVDSIYHATGCGVRRLLVSRSPRIRSHVGHHTNHDWLGDSDRHAPPQPLFGQALGAMGIDQRIGCVSAGTIRLVCSLNVLVRRIQIVSKAF